MDRHECCLWELLELVTHCGGDLDPVLRKTTDGDPPLLELLYDCRKSVKQGSPIALSRITRIVRLVSLYHLSSRGVVVHFLGDVIHEVDDGDVSGDYDSNIRSTLIALEESLTNVLSLTLLCRLCILHHVQCRDIHQLPLPNQLLKFVRVGGISPNYKFYDLIHCA